MSATAERRIPRRCAPPNAASRVRADRERSLATFLETVRIAHGEDAHDEIGDGVPGHWLPCATVYCPSLGAIRDVT